MVLRLSDIWKLILTFLFHLFQRYIVSKGVVTRRSSMDINEVEETFFAPTDFKVFVVSF